MEAVSAMSEILDTLKLLFQEGETVVVSHLFSDRKGMQKQFFTRVSDAAEYAQHEDTNTEVVATYVNIQRLKPSAIADKRDDIAAYTHFFVDFDRKVKKDANKDYMNATDAEREELFQTMRQTLLWLNGILGAKPLIGDSGNGFHLIYTLDRPCKPDLETMQTLRECLLAIKEKYESGNVEIDVSVAEPEQLARLYGTWNRRAPETQGRPHRRSRVLAKPNGTVLPSAFDVLSCEYEVAIGGK
jgi:hypothetical protein